MLKIINERDILRHKLYFDKSFKDVERKELENQMFIARDELSKEQKFNREKVTRLEDVIIFKIKFQFLYNFVILR